MGCCIRAGWQLHQPSFLTGIVLLLWPAVCSFCHYWPDASGGQPRGPCGKPDTEQTPLAMLLAGQAMGGLHVGAGSSTPRLQLGGYQRIGALLALERVRQLLDAGTQLPPLCRKVFQLPRLRDHPGCLCMSLLQLHASMRPSGHAGSAPRSRRSRVGTWASLLSRTICSCREAATSSSARRDFSL